MFLKKVKLKSIFSVIFLIFFSLPVWASPPCEKTPHASKMDEKLNTYLKNQVSGGSKVVFLPLADNSRFVEKDNLLSWAFPIILEQFSRLSGGKNVFHPFVVSLALEDLKLKENLNSAETAQKVADWLKADHVIFGQFQKNKNGTLRFFLHDYKASQKNAAGKIYEFESPSDDRLFSIVGDAYTALSAPLQLAHHKELLKIYSKESPSYQSFRYFIKGMMASGSYALAQLDLALAWFDRSATESYHFSLPLREKARVLFMKQLLYRLMGKDFSMISAQIDETRLLYERIEKGLKLTVTPRLDFGSEGWSHKAWMEAKKDQVLVNSCGPGADN